MNDQTGYRYNSKWTDLARSAFLGATWVSALFCLLTSALLVINHIQAERADPLNSPSLAKLIKDSSGDPRNEQLKKEIREMDLLARRAFFSSQTYTRIGGYMLLGWMIAFLVAAKTTAEFYRRHPLPDGQQRPPDPIRLNSAGRKAVAVSALALCIVALALAFKGPGTGAPAQAQVPQAPAAPAIAHDPRVEQIHGWPCFRGPGGWGVAHYTNAPVAWDGKTGQNILWKTPVPRPGHNSPVVWGECVFMSGADDQAREVYCFDAKTGALRWRSEVKDVPGSPATPPDILKATGRAPQTMATDGTRVFAMFTTADIACFDFAGKKLWARNLGVPDNEYGHSSSLIVYGGLLMVQLDSNTSGRVLALDTKTGTTVWDKTRPVTASWASPILANTGKRMELILNAKPMVISHDPATGDILWSIDCMQGEVAPSPAYAAGTVFVTTEHAMVTAIRADGQPGIKWQEDPSDMPGTASPVASDKFLFLASEGGKVTCLDAGTGALLWEHEYNGIFDSSPILVGDRVYMTDRKGVTRIVKAAGKFEEIATCELHEPVYATPAFLDGRIYIRSETNLYCIGK